MRDVRAIEGLIERAVRAGRMPGVAAAVATDEAVVWQGAFGKRALGGEAPMTMDTVFWIASMTKALTAAGAMQLVERGALTLDGPASDVVPEIGRARVLEGFDASGQPRLRPPKRPVTLRHLLTHTSGYSYEMWNADIGRYQDATGTPTIMTCTNACLTTPLVADPGERWEYGIGIDWAGKMVEAASGRKLGAFLEESLFGPLGMRDTSFRLSAFQRARLVTMHARAADGSLSTMPFEVEQDPEFEMGGGGLYSTVGDYLRFTRMILNRGTLDGVRVFSPETIELMSASSTGEVDVRPLRTVMPAYSNDCDFFPGMRQKWGLSFLINTEASPQGRSAGSLSWAGLGNAYYWIDRTKRRTGVLMAQILPFFDAEVVGLYRDFETAVNEAAE